MKKVFQDNGFSIVLAILFILSLAGQAVFQYLHEINLAAQHAQQLSTSEYLNSFLSAMFANWQAEFLQVFVIVVLTSFLSLKNPELKSNEQETKKRLERIETKIANVNNASETIIKTVKDKVKTEK
jgi:hypothetical protein